MFGNSAVNGFLEKRDRAPLARDLARQCLPRIVAECSLARVAQNGRMTRAGDAGVDLDRAGVAYGCNRETMKKHYIRKNALAIADQVFEKILGESEKKGSHEEPRPTQPNDEN